MYALEKLSGYTSSQISPQHDVAFEALASQVQRNPFVIESISEELVKLATRYGTERAQRFPSTEALAITRHEIGNATQVIREQLHHDPGLVEFLKRQVLEAIAEARLATYKNVVSEFGLTIGRASGRNLEEATIEQAKKNLSDYRDKHRDLGCSFENFDATSELLFAEAVRAGTEQRHQAERDAIVCFAAASRLFPDFAELEKILACKDRTRIELLKEATQQRYHKSVPELLRHCFNRPILKNLLVTKIRLSILLHLCAGEVTAADADRLALIVKGRKNKFASDYLKFLDRRDATKNGEAEKDFTKRYPTLKHEFADRVQSLPILVAERCEALRRGDRMHADVLGFHLMCFPARLSETRLSFFRAVPDSKTMRHVAFEFEAYSDEKRKDVIRAYQTRFGISLMRHIDERLPTCGAKDRILSDLKGDVCGAEAAQLKSFFEAHDIASMGELFLGQTASRRKELSDNYSHKYGDFWQGLRQSLNVNEVYFLTSIINTGEIRRAEALYYSVVGLATDEYGVKKCLKGLTAEGVAELEQEFSNLCEARIHKSQNLRTRLQWEVSGDAWYDVSELFEGMPLNANDAHNRLVQRHLRERSAPWFKRTRFITKEGAIAERDVGAAIRYFSEHASCEILSPECGQRLETLWRFAARDITAFRAVKNDLANLVANWTAGYLCSAGVIVAAIANGGIEHHLGAIGIAGFSACTVGRLLTKHILKGPSYGREELVKDLLLSGIDSGTPVAAQLITVTMGRRLFNYGAKAGLKHLMHKNDQRSSNRYASHNFSSKDLGEVMIADESDWQHWWKSETS